MLSRKIQLDCIELALTTSLLTSLAIMRNNHDNNYLNKLCENVVVLRISVTVIIIIVNHSYAL